MRRYELMSSGGGGRWEGGGVVYHRPKISSCEAQTDQKKKKEELLDPFPTLLYTVAGFHYEEVVQLNQCELLILNYLSAPSCFLSGHTVNPNSNWKADVRPVWKLHLHQSTCVLSLTWTTLPRRFHKHAHLSGHILQLTIFIIPPGPYINLWIRLRK